MVWGNSLALEIGSWSSSGPAGPIRPILGILARYAEKQDLPLNRAPGEATEDTDCHSRRASGANLDLVLAMTSPRHLHSHCHHAEKA